MTIPETIVPTKPALNIIISTGVIDSKDEKASGNADPGLEK